MTDSSSNEKNLKVFDSVSKQFSQLTESATKAAADFSERPVIRRLTYLGFLLLIYSVGLDVLSWFPNYEIGASDQSLKLECFWAGISLIIFGAIIEFMAHMYSLRSLNKAQDSLNEERKGLFKKLMG